MATTSVKSEKTLDLEEKILSVSYPNAVIFEYKTHTAGSIEYAVYTQKDCRDINRDDIWIVIKNNYPPEVMGIDPVSGLSGRRFDIDINYLIGDLYKKNFSDIPVSNIKWFLMNTENDRQRLSFLLTTFYPNFFVNFTELFLEDGLYTYLFNSKF